MLRGAGDHPPHEINEFETKMMEADLKANKPPRERSYLKADRRLRIYLIVPALIGIWVVIGFPLLYALYISFHDYVLSQGGIGGVNFANYLNIFNDKMLIGASRNTLVLTFSVVTLEFLIAFGLALLLNNQRVRGRNIYLLILLIPMLMPPITVGLIWRMLLHPELGIINYSLGVLGLPQPAWLGDPTLAMATVVIVDIWHETSFILLILLAGTHFIAQ